MVAKLSIVWQRQPYLKMGFQIHASREVSAFYETIKVCYFWFGDFLKYLRE